MLISTNMILINNIIIDSKLNFPYYKDPPLKFGTIAGGNTHAVLKANKPNLYNYMSRFNRPTVEDGKYYISIYIQFKVTMKY